MRFLSRLDRSLIVAMVALGLSAAPAGATSLGTIIAEIAANGSYSESLGAFTFEFTLINAATSVDVDEIDLVLFANPGKGGFDLNFATDAMAAVNGASPSLQIQYTVTSTEGMIGGSNLLESMASGFGDVAVSETIVEQPIVDLGVSHSDPFTRGFFNDSYMSLHIDTKNIVLFTVQTGDFAEINKLEQRFLVPEPYTAGQLMLGLLGLSWAGRRLR